MRAVRRLAIVFSMLLLLCSAILAFKVMSSRAGTTSTSKNLLDEPRHPVTEPMWQKARAVAGKPAPNFTLKTPDGKAVTLFDECKKGPVVIVFTKDGCPCSIESQPFFNELAKGYGDRAVFLGVIDGESHVASKYHDDFKVPYRMVLAENGDVFKSYNATQSVYTTLVGPDGVVVKQWPGYNRSMLVELDHMISKLDGGEEVRIDTTKAPEKMNSGCAFAMD